MPVINRIVSDIIVNITRSIPFAILMVALIPLARLLTGTSLGPVAASVSLSIGTIPFFARLVETCLRDVHHGKIDAAQVMGSTKMQVINKVMLPRIAARPRGGHHHHRGHAGRLLAPWPAWSAAEDSGKLAYNYGFQRFDVTVMIVTIVLIIVLVQVIQLVGEWISRSLDHR